MILDYVLYVLEQIRVLNHLHNCGRFPFSLLLCLFCPHTILLVSSCRELVIFGLLNDFTWIFPLPWLWMSLGSLSTETLLKCKAFFMAMSLTHHSSLHCIFLPTHITSNNQVGFHIVRCSHTVFYVQCHHRMVNRRKLWLIGRLEISESDTNPFFLINQRKWDRRLWPQTPALAFDIRSYCDIPPLPLNLQESKGGRAQNQALRVSCSNQASLVSVLQASPARQLPVRAPSASSAAPASRPCPATSLTTAIPVDPHSVSQPLSTHCTRICVIQFPLLQLKKSPRQK